MSTEPAERAKSAVREFLERVKDHFDPKIVDDAQIAVFRASVMSGERNPERPESAEGMTPAQMQEAYREHPDRASYDDGKGATLVEKAAHDALAAAALTEIAVEIIQRGEPLPPNLREFVVARLQHRPTGKQGRPRNQPRDTLIATAVALAREAGLRPTRDEASRDREGRESGCSIVSAALGELGHPVTERTIQNIWGKHKHMDPARN